MRQASALVPAMLCAWAMPAMADTAPEWRPDGMSDGLWVERREVRGSSYDEFRVITARSLDLSRFCDAIFAKGRDVQSSVHFKKRELLRETGTERWMYEQIAVPWVSDRDYVMHTKLEAPASSGRCEVSFATENDPSRPPVPGVVRIPAIRGHWAAAPMADGRLWIDYEIFSDPGGGIPAFLARGGQRSAAVDFVKSVIARVGGPVACAPASASLPSAGTAAAPPAGVPAQSEHAAADRGADPRP
ncbi:MAG TPA: hypothetical protein VEK07_25165 [Polyangiaceae bacterium]|nr:hypothetical protein [Polyangiaceae bacterium]